MENHEDEGKKVYGGMKEHEGTCEVRKKDERMGLRRRGGGIKGGGGARRKRWRKKDGRTVRKKKRARKRPKRGRG